MHFEQITLLVRELLSQDYFYLTQYLTSLNKERI